MFQLEDCVIFLLYISSESLAGSYCIPPNPGILAYLSRLHLIDLDHKVRRLPLSVVKCLGMVAFLAFNRFAKEGKKCIFGDMAILVNCKNLHLNKLIVVKVSSGVICK